MIEELLRKYSRKLSSSEKEKDRIWSKISRGIDDEKISFFKIVLKLRFLFSFVIVVSVMMLSYFQLNQYLSFTMVNESDKYVSEELAPSSKETSGSMKEPDFQNSESEMLNDQTNDVNLQTASESKIERYIKYLSYGSVILFTLLLIISYIKEKPYYED